MYLESAAREISTAARARMAICLSRRPRSQNTTAQIQKARVSVSHITLVLDTRKAGVNSVARLARRGRVHSRSARRYVPQTAARAGRRKARCKAGSLQPKTVAARAR